MTKRRRLIEFFEEYEANINSAILCDQPGASAAAGAFARCFVGSDAGGVTCGSNDEAFVRTIVETCRFYRSIGTRFLRLEGIDSTPIDEHHIMARVHWVGEYERPEGTKRVPFDAVYFVRLGDPAFQIFGYVTGNERAALREHGIIP
jgi:hypothetical protein